MSRSVDPLQGGGEMGALMRSIDWSLTPVGPVAAWPQSLRTALSILLETGFPMYIAWGPEFTQFYNDGYRPILGSTKHPAAMGISTRETFREIWDIIGPMFAGVMEGTATTVTDFLLPLDRHGFIEECYFIFSYSPIREEGGGVGGVLVTVTETSERIIGERRLKTLRELATETQETRSSHAACTAAIEVIRRNPADIPFAVIDLYDGNGRHEHCGSTESGCPEIENVIPSGTVRQIETADGRRALALPIFQPGATKPTGVLVAGLSPRLILDAKYQSFLELVAGQVGTSVASARSFEEARARAEALAELDRAKTAFFSNVSHEFRTPLTLMLGPIDDALEDDRLSPIDRERWTMVKRSGLRLLKLVNTLLDFASIEAGRVHASYAPVDLAQLTADLAAMFAAAVDRAGMRLVIECQALGEPIYVDRDMWEKIVLNLLSNAIKFTFEGEIAVALQLDGDHAQLTVRDTGIGVSPEELPALFDRFHRVHGARARTHEGTGIGLALVQELVKLHGGTIDVESVVERGTTFTVRIPRGRAHLPQDRTAAVGSPARAGIAGSSLVGETDRWIDPVTRSAAGPTEGPRILIADDNADMREYLQRLLSDRWNVSTAGDGEAALAMVQSHPPDLILSDIMMPRLDGLGLLSALRADPRTRAIPVIFLSARAGEETRVEGLEAGADDYLVKPFSARELIARVGTHLELARFRSEASHSRDRLYAQFMQAPMPVSVLRGPDHVFDLVNPLFETMVGRTELIGKPARAAFAELPPDASIFTMLDRVFQTGEPFTAEEFLVPLDRTHQGKLENAYFKVSCQPVRESDRIVGVMTVAIDVTAQLVARRELETASRSKDEFLAMLGHELRNPLAPILTALQLMRLRGEDTLQKEREIIERQVNHVIRLVDDLLDVSRITRGKVDLKRERSELADVVARGVEMASPLIEQRRHQLEIAVPRQGMLLDVDRVRLAQVIANLLTNAAKYTESQGQIHVGATRDQGTIVLSVRDNGIGIRPEMLPSVFELFVQEQQPVDRAEGGLGLGLAIVRSLIQLHGGSVEAKSPGLGQGSEFVVRLPSADTSTPPAGISQSERAAAGRRSGLKVLVVDDNVDAADMMVEGLRALGHDARVAYDGPAAIEVAVEFSPNVALLDIGLPVMDGYDLAGHLRKLPGPKPCLIAVTGYGQDGDRRRSKEAGFDKHLVKPIDIDEIGRILATLQPASANNSRSST